VSVFRTVYTLVGNTKQRGVGDLFKRGLMAAFMLRMLELTPFFFNGGSDPRNVKLQVIRLILINWNLGGGGGGAVSRSSTWLPNNGNQRAKVNKDLVFERK
jgi:hypothetical protein